MVDIAVILPNLGGGGAERLHVNLAQEWKKGGKQIDFVLMRQEGPLLDLLSQTVSIYDLQVTRIRHAILPLVVYFRRRRPSVCIAAMWPLTSIAIIAWNIAGRPGRLFVSDHTHLSTSCVRELGITPSFLGWTVRLTYPFATGVIAVSRGVKEDLCRLSGIPDERVKVIYNPVARGLPPTGEPPLTREQLWGKGGTYNVLSIGSLKAQKDHLSLIEAFALLPAHLGARLTILGEGPMRPQLEVRIGELKLNGIVSLRGFVPDPYPWLRTADLFVLSSEWEGFGNVIVEALECGVPVVSTDCPSGPSEILCSGRYGKLVPTRDPAALSLAIQESLRERRDPLELWKRAQDFSIQRISSEYLGYFSELQVL